MGITKERIVCAAIAVFAALLISGCGDKPPPNLVNSPEDASGRFIGAISGSPSERLAGELGTARVFSSGEELMAHLKVGTIDCVIMENSTAIELVSDTAGVRILSEALLEHDLRFAVAKENSELLAAVNSALLALNDNGTLNGLRDRYFAGKSYTYTPPEDVVPRPGFLSLAVPPDSPPYSYKDADGEFFGLDIDIARAVCDYLGVELRIVEYDARELVTAVWFGKADLSLGWLPSEGEELINISEPYASMVHVIIVRR